jgi:hypothetical protein
MMGTTKNLAIACLLAVTILPSWSPRALALVIPGPPDPDARESRAEQPVYRREVRAWYSSSPMHVSVEREISISYRGRRPGIRQRRSTLQEARTEVRTATFGGGSFESRSNSGIISYRNSSLSRTNRRYSPGTRLRGAQGQDIRRPATTYTTASWYGWDFHGRQTANGEVYNMYDRTAAHRTLPFGTMVRVTNLRNGLNTVVRINDRGPFVAGRDIDLSYGTARHLGMLDTGVERVRMEILPG